MATYTAALTAHLTLYYDVWESSVDTANNTSVVSWNLRMTAKDGWTYNGGLDFSATVNSGVVASGSIYPYNTGVNGTVTCSTGSVTVAHETDGSKTISNSGWIDSGFGAGTGSGTLGLTQINRYATITGVTNTPSDVNFTTRVQTNVTCDLLETNLDGAGFTTAHSGDFTDVTETIGSNLTSNAVHTLVVRVRRKDSQLKTTSGTYNVTTLAQNNFMGLLE